MYAQLAIPYVNAYLRASACIYRRTHISIRRKIMRTHACAYPCQFYSSIKTSTPMLMPTSHRSRQKKCPQVHANSKGSYQSANPCSPMRVFAIRTEHVPIPMPLRFQKDCTDSHMGVTETAMFHKYTRPCTRRCTHKCPYLT